MFFFFLSEIIFLKLVKLNKYPFNVLFQFSLFLTKIWINDVAMVDHLQMSEYISVWLKLLQFWLIKI